MFLVMTNVPFDVATSPSGCAILCIAVGAIAIGVSRSIPSTLHLVSRCDTSIKTRGRIRMLLTLKYIQINLKYSQIQTKKFS